MAYSARKVLGVISGILITTAVGLCLGERWQLARTEISIDFKDEGYYKTIPHIALQGNLFFISDNFNHRVLEYRLDGSKLEFLRVIGRPGQGPGDLEHPHEISVSKETLAVHDEHGISFFGFDGAFRSKFQLLSKSVAMLFTGDEVITATNDPGKDDLIQVYDTSGALVRSFSKKLSLYPIRYDIHRGLTPDTLESIMFEGILRSQGGVLYYLNKRFGDVLQFDRGRAQILTRNVIPLLSKAEKAKADENRKMFLEAGFDLIKTNGDIPHNCVFEDAQVRNERLFLLMGNFDLLENRPRPYTEIIEIDLRSWAVVNSYVAPVVAKWESASIFLLVGDDRIPAFIIPIWAFDEEPKIYLFTPKR